MDHHPLVFGEDSSQLLSVSDTPRQRQVLLSVALLFEMLSKCDVSPSLQSVYKIVVVVKLSCGPAHLMLIRRVT